MNKTYRTVWSEADQTWVAAPETAAARGKSRRRLAVLATGAAGLAAAFAPGASFATTKVVAPVAGTVGQGGLELCSGAKGYAWGSSGANEAIDCTVDGTTVDGLAFSLNNAADTKGGYGFNASTAQVAGYENGTLNVKGASIMMYGPTTFDSIVTMSNQKIVQLAPGLVSAQSTEAINGSQLWATNQSIANLQEIGTGAVMYDTPDRTSVTLGGAAAMAPVALRNVAAADLAPASTDAVNGSQLYAVDQSVTYNTTAITNLRQSLYDGTIGLVQQDPATRNITVGKDTDGTVVDLTGTAGARRLTGLANGTGGSDAVSVAQMQSAGFQLDGSGTVMNAAVTYNAGSIASGSPTITLATGSGDSAYYVNGDRAQGFLPKGTVISNVADGLTDTDATNVGQVHDMISKATGGDNDAAPAILAARNLAAAGTGSGVDAAQLTRSYQTAAYYSQVSGLGDNTGSTGPSDMARAWGAGSIAVGSNAFANGANGVALGTQAYTPANDAVALGSGSVANQENTVSVGNDGTGSYVAFDANGQPYTIQNLANTRRIVNLAAGQGDTDAVNVAQLKGTLDALGGGATVNSDGTVRAPSYVLGGTTVNTVGAALANLDTRVTQNTTAIAALGGGTGGSGGTGSGAATDPAAPTATDPDALRYDTSAHDSLTLSSTTGGDVSLTGLRNATLSASSTGAVTGQQLFATNQQLASLDQAVQNVSTNGSTALSTNSTSGPAAAAGTQSAAVGGGAVATGNNATAIGDKANASAANSVALGANSIANRANAVSVGQEGAERQVVNVAAGTSGTDAVNVDQMNTALTQQSSTMNQRIAGLQDSIHTVQKNAYAGVAAAMAMPNLTPSGPGRTIVAAGGGYYKGGSAAAVGVTYRSTNMHWLVNGAVSVTNNGDAGARAQVGYEF